MDKDIIRREPSNKPAHQPAHQSAHQPARFSPPNLPEWPELPEFSDRTRAITIGVLAVIALLSFFVLGPHFSSPEAYTKTIESLDQKKETVMGLTGASTGTSAAVTLLPGDVGTPIAEKLVDLSSDFLIVIAAIYLEKYLLTVLGFVAFRILVPLGCFLLIVALVSTYRSWQTMLFALGIKVVIFGVAISVIVPASVGVSRMIESTYQASIEQTVENAKKTATKIEESTQKKDKDGNIITEIVDTVTGSVNQLAESARTSLNDFIESLAVMIVTSCIIPILVLLFFIWLLRILFGVSIELPNQLLRPRSFGPHKRKRTP